MAEKILVVDDEVSLQETLAYNLKKQGYEVQTTGDGTEALDLARAMEANRWMRRFDFDPEAAVRLCWKGLRPINVPAPVRYFRPEEGGVSHFNYYRDNVLLTWMHTRLMLGFVARLPLLTWRRMRGSRLRSSPR